MNAPTLLSVAIIFLAAACSKDGGTAKAAEEGGKPATTLVDVDNPKTCLPCHQNVVAEWQTSMHSRAHQKNDPIFAAVRKLRMKVQGEGVAAKCAQCHNPRAPKAPDSVAGLAGVSCTTCHNLSGIIHEHKGAKALVRGEDGVFTGPHDIKKGASPVHGTSKSPPWMRDGSSLCLACHRGAKTGAGLDSCTTGAEFDATTSAETCVSCHMPRKKGPAGSVGGRTDHASHAFLGPHHAIYQGDATMLNGAAALTGSMSGVQVKIAIENLARHSFPTGFPGRVLVLKVEGFDKAGERIWTPEPTKFIKVYLGKDGKRTMAFNAASLKSDTRLKPGEKRELTFTTLKSVARVDATLVYRLAGPKLLQKLNLAEDPVAKPVVVKKISIAR